MRNAGCETTSKPPFLALLLPLLVGCGKEDPGAICPTVRDVGDSELTDHRYLSKDLSVQQTVRSNGTVVTVNFGKLPDGASVVAKAK